jgi:hypothetical protein
MQLSQNAQVLDAVVRMVVPMRREFGCSLDVQAFMRDAVYAHQVLGQALGSQVERLRQYAEVAQRNWRPVQAAAAPAAPVVAANAAPALRAQASPAAQPVPSAGFASRRREAVQRLLALVGPVAEPLCIRIEKARAPEDLAPLLHLAQQIIANQRGADAAREYLAGIDRHPAAAH